MNYLKWGTAALLLALAFGVGYRAGDRAGTLKVAKLTTAHAEETAHVADLAVKAANAARAAEHQQALAFDTAANTYEQDKAHAQADFDRTVADLRAGNLRLRDRWAAQCLATEAAARAGVTDARAADREESAGRIVRAAAEADAQIRGLQAILKAERQ